MSLPEPRSPEEKLPADSDLQAQSVLVGGGLIAGAAVGAAIGVMVSRPVGVVVGAGIGAVAGAAGAVNTAASDQRTLQDPGR